MHNRYIARISNTTKRTNIKIYHNIWNMKMHMMMQYYDVKTNRRWRTAAMLKIVILPCLSEQVALLSQRGRAMLCTSLLLASTVIPRAQSFVIYI